MKPNTGTLVILVLVLPTNILRCTTVFTKALALQYSEAYCKHYHVPIEDYVSGFKALSCCICFLSGRGRKHYNSASHLGLMRYSNCSLQDMLLLSMKRRVETRRVLRIRSCQYGNARRCAVQPTMVSPIHRALHGGSAGIDLTSISDVIDSRMLSSPRHLKTRLRRQGGIVLQSGVSRGGRYLSRGSGQAYCSLASGVPHALQTLTISIREVPGRIP
jgi:hypothetical protein